MLHQTRGIALTTLKFSETSIIAKVYTELFGLQSYLLKGIRKKQSRIKPGLFQPLTLLELSVYHKEKITLHSLKEGYNCYPYQTIPFDIRKSSIALFMTELVYKSIREEESNSPLFKFLWNSCLTLDNIRESFSWFHVAFSVQFSRYLGILPQADLAGNKHFFDMKEGIFQECEPGHPYFLDKQMSSLLKDLLLSDSLVPGTLHATLKTRNELLEKILHYYSLHLAGFRGVQSHKILHSVLS